MENYTGSEREYLYFSLELARVESMTNAGSRGRKGDGGREERGRNITIKLKQRFFVLLRKNVGFGVMCRWA